MLFLDEDLSLAEHIHYFVLLLLLTLNLLKPFGVDGLHFLITVEHVIQLIGEAVSYDLNIVLSTRGEERYLPVEIILPMFTLFKTFKHLNGIGMQWILILVPEYSNSNLSELSLLLEYSIKRKDIVAVKFDLPGLFEVVGHGVLSVEE